MTVCDAESLCYLTLPILLSFPLLLDFAPQSTPIYAMPAQVIIKAPRASPLYSSSKGPQTPSFLRSNSERRAAEHNVRIHHPIVPSSSPSTSHASHNNNNNGHLDQQSFLVARAAAIDGSLSFLKKLLSKTPRLITAMDESRRNLLIYAALSGQTACVEWFVAKDGGRADVRAKDRDGMTAVHWAVHKGQHRTLKVLLKKGNGDPLIPDNEGATALHMAVKQPSTKCLDVLIEFLTKRDQLDRVVSVVDKGGRSALHWAAAAGKIPELLKLMKDKLKVTFEEPDHEGRTPMMWAVLSASSTIATLEAMTQRAPRSLLARDNAGCTALHLAVMVDNIAAIQHFLNSCELCDPNIVDPDGRTPLHWAGTFGRPGAATLLLGAKADLGRMDKSGSLAVHYAAENGFVEALKTMFKHYAEDPRDVRGRTCFMRAAASGSIDTMMSIWNTTRAVDRENKDKRGYNALHLAAMNGHDAAVKFLLDRGYSTDVRDSQGRSPLHSAAEHGHGSILQLLLKSGAAVWHRDSNGRTALHWAALGGHAYVCQLLIKQGVSVDAVDAGGRTAVHCASFGDFVGCLCVLLQAGAHPCIPDNEGSIPLHLAAGEGNLNVCKRLVDSGSLLNSVLDDEIHRKRMTPLDLAVINEHSHVIEYLLENDAMTYEQLLNVAATKVQACYRGYRARKGLRSLRPSIVISSPSKFERKK